MTRKHEAFCRYLLQARKAAGKTQIALGAEIGKRGPQVSSWETGSYLPSNDTLPALARALGVDEEELRRARYGDTPVVATNSPSNDQDQSILSLIKAIAKSNIDEVTWGDLNFLAGVQQGLPQEMPASLVEELLKQRRG